MEHGKLGALKSSEQGRRTLPHPEAPDVGQTLPNTSASQQRDDWNLYVVALSPSIFPSPPLRFLRLLTPFNLEMTTVPFSDDGIGIANLPNQVSCDSCLT